MLKFSFRYCNRFSFHATKCFSIEASQYVLDRNKTIYSVLKPYLDFDEKLENLDKLENNIKLRGLDIKLPSLISMWNHYKNVKEDVINLEKERVRITSELAGETEVSPDADKIKSLKFLGLNVRENLKKLKVILSQLEEQLHLQVLQLPNDISEKSNEILYSNDIPKSGATNDHLQVGHDLGVIEYISPRSFFLKGPAAVFELVVSNIAANLFINNGFVRFSNPDFTRNSIVKYLNLKDIQSLLPLEKFHDDVDVDKLHLHGGASVLPFSCFHSKTITDFQNMPVQYVTKGRHYAHNELPGLYGVWQNTAVQIFVGTNEERIDKQINSLANILTDFYKSFEIPLRIVYSDPKNLSDAEKLRISFQTFSSFNKQYVELGHISSYGDYISKRLRIYYSDNENNKFMHIISGTILKIQPLLASILEYKKEYIVNKNFI